MAPRMEYDLRHHKLTQIRPPYPPGTKAFLYYSTSPEKPRIGGELRLRVSSGDDFRSFESGSDLLKSNGRPWTRPLYSLSKYCLPLYEKLREERFVSDDLDAVLSTLPSKALYHSQTQLLYTLYDTFILDFTISTRWYFVITGQGVEKLSLAHIFYDDRVLHMTTPYTGAYTNHHLSILYIDS